MHGLSTFFYYLKKDFLTFILSSADKNEPSSGLICGIKQKFIPVALKTVRLRQNAFAGTLWPSEAIMGSSIIGFGSNHILADLVFSIGF
jgi:hypothetical protein